jgi:polysaccharide biosynthesis/export protein ExoF
MAIAFWPACATIAAAQSLGGATGGAAGAVNAAPNAAGEATNGPRATGSVISDSVGSGTAGEAAGTTVPAVAGKATASVAQDAAGRPSTGAGSVQTANPRMPPNKRAKVDYKTFSPERMLGAKLMNAERVIIRIQGHPTLSGEYRVNGDGTIALPSLGRFEVFDSTIADFETQLADEVTRITSRESNVTIEVIDYKPVFVSGTVARAGAFPWKPGLSILQAETLAGGMVRETGAPGMAPLTDREKDRAIRAAYELASTLVTVARLRTERENSDKLVVLAKLSDLVSASDQAGLMAAQEATLRSRNTAYTARVTALLNSKATALKELGALQEQRVRMHDQLSKRRVTLKKIERVAEQGFIRADRVFEDQIKISELEERLTNATIAISRIEANAAAAQMDLDVHKLGRIAEIDTEVLRHEQRISQLELEIDSANGMFRRITGHDVVSTRASRAPSLSYEIIRTETGVSKVIRADRSTLLQPGDVVMVSLDGSS